MAGNVVWEQRGANIGDSQKRLSQPRLRWRYSLRPPSRVAQHGWGIGAGAGWAGLVAALLDGHRAGAWMWAVREALALGSHPAMVRLLHEALNPGDLSTSN